jgi:hypothetical protein
VTDHLCTCTAHSVSKKAHDWEADHITDLFHRTHKVKSQQVDRRRGQECGDIELTGYLSKEEGPVFLVLDLHMNHIGHERFGSRSNPPLNGHLHYPNDIDGSLND